MRGPRAPPPPGGRLSWRWIPVGILLLVAARLPSLRLPGALRRGLFAAGGPCGNGADVELLEVPASVPRLGNVGRVVLLTHVAAPDRAAAVIDGWARPRCLQLVAGAPPGAPALGFVAVSPFFFTTAPEMAGFGWGAADALHLPSNTSGAMRTARALPAALARFPNATWVVKADDDALVHVGRLVRALVRRDASAPALVGSLMLWSFPRFVSGGAGYALSAAAAAGLAPVMDACADAHHQGDASFRATNFEDVMVTWCVRAHFGDAAIVDEPGLNYNSPEEMVASGTFVDAKAAADPITFHYIPPARAASLYAPRAPRVLTQAWPFGDDARGVAEAADAGVPALAANVASCRAAARAAGLDYALVRASGVDSGGGGGESGGGPAALPYTWKALSALPPRARELLARAELLHARGGVSVSVWARCAQPDDDAVVDNGYDGARRRWPRSDVAPARPAEVLAAVRAAVAADAAREAAARPRVVDPVGSTGVGSATGHVLACARAGGSGDGDDDGACGVAAGTQFAHPTLRLTAALLQAAALRAAAWPPPAPGTTDAAFEAWLTRAATLAALAPVSTVDAGAPHPPPPRGRGGWLTWGEGAASAAAAAAGRAAADGDALLPPLRVAQSGMWAGTAPVLAELELLSRVVHSAVGRRLVAVVGTLPQEQQLDAADVILIGPHGELATAVAVARRYAARALTVFIGSENQWGGAYHDQMAQEVHVSLGHRRDLVAPNYLRLPWWLPYVIDAAEPGAAPDGVRFSRLLMAAGAGHGVAEAAAWAARPRAAALLPSSDVFPRSLLLEMLTAAGVLVDAPGKAVDGAEWPAGRPSAHLDGKLQFLTRFRFNVCPEDSASGGGGYVTEKLPHALMAGTVPIYWGDALDAAVFNPRRVLVFDGGNNATILAAIASLEGNADARARWFAEPILAPTARTWLRVWVGVAGELLRAGLERVAAARSAFPAAS